MILDTWGGVLNNSFQSLWAGVIKFIPNLIVAIVIFCIGWAIGAVIAKGIAHFMKMIKFDEALQKAGFEGFVRKSGLNLNSGHFLGGIVKYFIIIVFLMASFDVSRAFSPVVRESRSSVSPHWVVKSIEDFRPVAMRVRGLDIPARSTPKARAAPAASWFAPRKASKPFAPRCVVSSSFLTSEAVPSKTPSI
ncbi:MAG: Small-conductance mechanosensitive ion channel-like protein [Parcubacteria group bacterium GW2011_GWB1_40_5]|nr:MAG: Small-conductance mechanosensitive ion channel-like protein [Parcubacteria group bacterium GW2011_GWB1_40_5]